jgi:DNA-binding transcriptional regulator PaaX
VFDDKEVLVVVNPHGTQARGARIVVDANLAADGMQVVLNTDPNAPPSLRPGAWLPQQASDVWRYLAIDRDLLPPSEVMVLANQSAIESARMKWRG